MAITIIGLDSFRDWYHSLDEAMLDDVTEAVDFLEAMGVELGFPMSSAIKGSKYALRELRIQSHGHPLRVFYAFDPLRQAILLLGGDKTGDKRFYERMIRTSEALWREYMIGEGHEDLV